MSTDPWYYPRTNLAEKLLSRFDPGPVEGIALHAPRRDGKTSFLLGDLATAGADKGLQPVFIDLWANRERPGEAIADGLEAAARRCADPDFKYGTVLGRFAKEVTSIGALGVSIGMREKERPGASAPSDTLSRIGYWMDQLVASSNRPILLMVDEAGTLSSSKDGHAVASALRAALQRHGRLECRPVFSASSREALAQLFDAPTSPFYRFGISERFPAPDDGIAKHFAKCLKASSGIDVPVTQLVDAYHQLGRKPAALRTVVAAMDAEGDPRVERFVQRQLGNEESAADKRAHVLKSQLAPIDIAVLREIASDRPQLWGADALGRIAADTGVPIVNPRSLDEAFARLRAAGLVARVERGQYEVEDHEAAHALLQSDVLEPRIIAGANATMAIQLQPGYITASIDTRKPAFEDAGRSYELSRLLADVANTIRESPSFDEVFDKLRDLNGNVVGKVEWRETTPLVDPAEHGVFHLAVRAGDTSAEIVDEIAENVRLGATSFVVRAPDGTIVANASVKEPDPEAEKLLRIEMAQLRLEWVEHQLKTAGFAVDALHGAPVQRFLPAPGTDEHALLVEWDQVKRSLAEQRMQRQLPEETPSPSM